MMTSGRTKTFGGVDYDRCECCGRTLRDRLQLLELDQRDDTYHNRRDVPADKSQGWFTFGWACAERIKANGGRLIRRR
jgi:hypothetical protein